MALLHVSDGRIRGLLGAPPLLELLDRCCLRWAGHCARMSEARLPLQLLSAEVGGWTRGGRGADTTYFRNSHRVARALRRFGIARDVWWDAAQDAGRWRARLRRGWRRNPGGGNDDSDASVDGGGDGGDWPRREDFPRNCRRAVRVLHCEHCTYRTHHAA